MRIGITFEINVRWSDNRLNFRNLDPTGENVISIESLERLWLPCENFRHDNAILGEIVTEGQRKVKVANLTSALPGNAMQSVENYRYNGAQTQISM